MFNQKIFSKRLQVLIRVARMLYKYYQSFVSKLKNREISIRVDTCLPSQPTCNLKETNENIFPHSYHYLHVTHRLTG